MTAIHNLTVDELSAEQFHDSDRDTLIEGTPFVIYHGDEHYVKTRFSFKEDLTPLQFNDNELSERKIVRKALKKSNVKLSSGDHFVWRKTPGGSEIIPGWGVVLSNLYGRLWGVPELELMVKQNIRGILWEIPDGELIYYEASATPRPQVQAVSPGYDIDGAEQ